jgi:hypothetical protein
MTRKFGICAVCGKRHGETYDFTTTLRRLGVMKGDAAVPECVVALQKKVSKRRVREGHKPRPWLMED